MTPVPDEALRDALELPTAEWRSREGMRDAAVIAPWFTRDGSDHLLYTVRNADLERHAGEISFPGGTREGDEDALGCALREMREEIGLAPERERVLGRLPERRSSVGFQVHAFVARIEPPRDVVIDPTEVDEVIEIAVAELRRPERWEYRRLAHAGRSWSVPFFELGDRTLWGLTARLTLDLLGRLE